MKITKRLLVLVCVICLAGIATVCAQTSPNYDLSWQVIGGGGGPLNSTNYRMAGTVGQVIGGAESANYRLEAGYWSGILAAGEPAELPVHNLNTGVDFETIQAAIDDAATVDGHTIEVERGTYYENVIVHKRLTIRSQDGAATCIVQAADSTEHVFTVTADYVNISGFTVTNATGYGQSGLYLGSGVEHCTISNITASENYYGFFLSGADHTTLKDNTGSNNSQYGFEIAGTKGCLISGNEIYTSYVGICLLAGSDDNYIGNNYVHDNVGAGIDIRYNCNNNTIIGNHVSNNSDGIDLMSNTNSTVKSNVVYNNIRIGIYLWLSGTSGDLISGNEVYGNGDGIILRNSSGNVNCSSNEIYSNNNGIGVQESNNSVIVCNNIVASNYCGVYLSSSSNNAIYNNYFNNTNNAYDTGINRWNSSKTPGRNIIGGPWLGGNYWSDYTGADTNGDGIGDTSLPHTASGNIVTGGDWLPLVRTEEEEEPFKQVPVGVTSDISLAGPEEIAGYLPADYEGVDLSDAVVLSVNVTDDTPGNTADDAYTDITINVGGMDIATCTLFKTGTGFLPEVADVATLPTVDGEPAFSRELGNNTITVRLYVGDPLLAVLPPAGLPVLDTGEGSYPCLSGTFTGTITPSRNLTVSTLYTYSCPGTGGHTKSIELYENTTVIASGVWSGHQGDWHNVTFNHKVTLLKDHEYRSVIVTGSYPQIIHARDWNATGGVVTCTEFVDVNDVIHYDWVPAIQLQ